MTNPRYFGDQQWQTSEKTGPFGMSMFNFVFICGLIIIGLILIGREAINWYIKHNAILDQLNQMKQESRRTNDILQSIQKQIKGWRQTMQNGDIQTMTSSRGQRNMRYE